MKVNWIKSIACGLGFAGLAAMPQTGVAQQGQYVAPSAWNNFQPGNGQMYRTTTQAVDPASPQYRTASAPAPAARPAVAPQQGQYAPQAQYQYAVPPSLAAAPQHAPQAASGPAYSVARRGGAMIDGGGHEYSQALPTGVQGGGQIVSEQYGTPAPHAGQYVPAPSPYIQAASSNWDGAGSCGPGGCGPVDYGVGSFGCGEVRPPLSPWFGGGSVLFWSMANDSHQRLLIDGAMPSDTYLSTGDVDPQHGIGYELFFGKYLACGKYAISASYMNLDLGNESAVVSMPANPYLSIAAFDHIGFADDPANPGMPVSMTDFFSRQDRFQVDRDVSFQGVELSMWSFGFGGARRLAPAYGTGLNAGLGGKLGHGNACVGYGGFGGPLEKPCNGSSQVAFMHGFRWFQFNDDFALTASGNPAMPSEYARFDSQAQNDLLGYQLGGRWNYVATCRLNLGIGVKAGVYANNVEVSQRVGDRIMPAHYDMFAGNVPAGTYDNVGTVDHSDSGTVLSTLAEIDLGFGYRLTDAWTLRGGYRVLGASGVATSIGMIKHEMFRENLMARKEANNSVILHGAYAGAEYNW